MPRFTFDNHSRSVESARTAVTALLGSKLKSVSAGTNATRVVVETNGNITSAEQNNIAKVLAGLPKVAVAETPAAKQEPKAPVEDAPKSTEAPVADAATPSPAEEKKAVPHVKVPGT